MRRLVVRPSKKIKWEVCFLRRDMRFDASGECFRASSCFVFASFCFVLVRPVMRLMRPVMRLTRLSLSASPESGKVQKFCVVILSILVRNYNVPFVAQACRVPSTMGPHTQILAILCVSGA